MADRTEDDDGSLIYAAARIGHGVVEVSEANERSGPIAAGVHLYVPDTRGAHQAAIAAGASELYAPARMPYGEVSSGVVDPYGNHWYLATFEGDPRI